MINILGVKYDIRETQLDYDTLGRCNRYSKVIELNKDLADICECKESIDVIKAQVLRHEILHAAFHECGLSKYAEDESLVELLAIQFPKIIQAMKEGEAL